MGLYGPEPPSMYASRGASASAAVTPGRATLVGLTCENRASADRWIQFHNTTAALSSGVTTLGNFPEFKVPAGGYIVIDVAAFNNAGVTYDAAIRFGFSTTSGTYTAGSAADCYLQVFYL